MKDKKILKENKIEPTGTYHYDEEYLHENGIQTVRLAIIDAVTNLIINNQVINQEDFDKESIETFLKYSLKGLPKKILITDGHTAYPPIIEEICMKQQLCIFHIIKKHNDKAYKIMNKIKRRIKTLERKIKNNSEKINKLRTKNKGLKGRTSKKDITIKRRIEKRKRLHEENKKYREELKEKRKEIRQ